MSAILLATGMVFLAAALRRLKFHSPFLAAFAVAFVPGVYISSTVTMDYVPALCFAMIALYASLTDRPVAAVPTTVGPDRPPKYPTTYYTDYMTWYQKRNYDVLNADQQAAD